MSIARTTNNPPYAVLGAGNLVSGVWKVSKGTAWRYRFNVYRLSRQNGDVSQLLAPADIEDLVKLCQVLASVLADDGCLREAERRKLALLAALLDPITRRPE